MRRLLAIVGFFALAGCGSSGAGTSTTPTVPALPGETVTTRQSTPISGARATAAAAQITVSPSYAAIVSRVCHDLASRNAPGITSLLPYYQYNSGLRYGQMGDGEGQTGDISLMSTWLRRSAVRCLLYTQGQAGHGVLLTRGWSHPGGWALIDLDTYNGRWKINDFTFGQRGDVLFAIHVANPVLQYRG